MKKTFPLTHPKIQPPRLVDGIRAEVNKYIKRERRKTLPEGADYWDFDCRVGANPASAAGVHSSAISRSIGEILDTGSDAVYVEVLAKPAKRQKRKSL